MPTNISTSLWTRKRLITRIVATWIVTSFVGTLTICCDLFASTTKREPTLTYSPANKDASHAGSYDHHHLHGDKQATQFTPDDSDHCAATSIPGLAASNYTFIQFPDPGKKLTAGESCNFTLLMPWPVSISQFESEPPPVSPPRYLLFHRLLIAHLDA